MIKNIRYVCEECSVSVQIAIGAPPRDTIAAVQIFQNFFYKCPRCGEEMQEYVPNGYGHWRKIEENEQR